jgi:hypothetical protein
MGPSFVPEGKVRERERERERVGLISSSDVIK